MTQIWKFTLKLIGRQAVELPALSDVISVQMQAGAICLWALVNPDAHKVERYFRIIGTGHAIRDEGVLTFLSTVQDDDLVWHVFEERR